MKQFKFDGDIQFSVLFYINKSFFLEHRLNQSEQQVARNLSPDNKHKYQLQLDLCIVFQIHTFLLQQSAVKLSPNPHYLQSTESNACNFPLSNIFFQSTMSNAPLIQLFLVLHYISNLKNKSLYETNHVYSSVCQSQMKIFLSASPYVAMSDNDVISKYK